MYNIVGAKFEKETAYFAIGGFIFLRFICPAVVAPEAYGISKVPISTGVRRSLLLVSKIIQNIANGIKQAKEAYMTCADDFILLNQSKIVNYYEYLSKIPTISTQDGEEEMKKNMISLIPIPLVDESLSIIHRIVIQNIDKLKEYLQNTDETELVCYEVYENLSTVLLKANIVLDPMKTASEQVKQVSSPLYKPYYLFIDAILADGCSIVANHLLSHISDMTDKEIITEALMVIVHQHGDSMRFIKSLINKEINKINHFHDLMENPSIGNLLFFSFLKVLNREFLIIHWKDLIVKINEENELIEIDPLRVPPDFDLMKSNEKLTELTKLFLNKLLDNKAKIDRQTREVCAYVQMKLLKKFGKIAKNNQKQVNIDETFTIKLFCERVFSSAIAFPSLFHLLPDLPNSNARRTFFLISQVIKQFLYYVRPFHDGFLIGLNHLIITERERVNEFLHHLILPSVQAHDSKISWDTQTESFCGLHQQLSKNLDILKVSLGNKTNKETIIYNIFDRLAAVITLYRFRLRRRIESGVFFFFFFFFKNGYLFFVFSFNNRKLWKLQMMTQVNTLITLIKSLNIYCKTTFY